MNTSGAPRVASFIAGRYSSSSSGVMRPITDPSTDEVIRIADLAGPDEVDAAVGAAKSA